MTTINARGYYPDLKEEMDHTECPLCKEELHYRYNPSLDVEDGYAWDRAEQTVVLKCPRCSTLFEKRLMLRLVECQPTDWSDCDLKIEHRFKGKTSILTEGAIPGSEEEMLREIEEHSRIQYLRREPNLFTSIQQTQP